MDGSNESMSTDRRVVIHMPDVDGAAIIAVVSFYDRLCGSLAQKV